MLLQFSGLVLRFKRIFRLQSFIIEGLASSHSDLALNGCSFLEIFRIIIFLGRLEVGRGLFHGRKSRFITLWLIAHQNHSRQESIFSLDVF